MAKKKFEIEAALRETKGKGASRRLRREEMIPGIVYGGGKDAVSLTIAHKQLSKVLEHEAAYSQILSLKTGTEQENVVLKDLQRHPYKPRIMHVDFQRVRADVKLYMNIPLHFIGEEAAPGVKAGGMISHIMNDIEVTCFPADLPDHLEIDVSNLELNQTLHLSDIKLPKGVEIVPLQHEDDRPIVSIHILREEEVPTEAPVAVEVPATAQKGEEPESK